ncbi:hypothetical protein [Hydrogenovibrio halophilus]|uniref:hypothetical protein n=1 Tax=Hydrogenovibrio halophilus TaxID=373391 RepID=UPI00035D47E5|nr:hypothetical protein [Hydrogenovibrio halophilus]
MDESVTRGLIDLKNGLNLSVVLVDGQKLAELMIEPNLGVNTKAMKSAKLNLPSQNPQFRLL